MEINNGRLVLNASLRNILENNNTFDNVKKAEEVLRYFANLANNTQYFIQQRQDSRLLKEKLGYQELESVAYFKSFKQDKKDYRIISFKEKLKCVEFYFRKMDLSFADNVLNLANSGNLEDIEKISQGIIADALSNKDNRSRHEILLGKNAKNLDNYLLEHVDVVEGIPKKLFGIFNLYSKNRNTVYMD